MRADRRALPLWAPSRFHSAQTHKPYQATISTCHAKAQGTIDAHKCSKKNSQSSPCCNFSYGNRQSLAHYPPKKNANLHAWNKSCLCTFKRVQRILAMFGYSIFTHGYAWQRHRKLLKLDNSLIAFVQLHVSSTLGWARFLKQVSYKKLARNWGIWFLTWRKFRELARRVRASFLILYWSRLRSRSPLFFL